MLSFLSRLAPYRKAIVAAVGAILTAVAPLLPVGSTAAQVITTVLAIGTTLGVWAVPNRPARVTLNPTATAPSMAQVRALTGETQTGGSTTPPTTTGGGTTPPAARL